MTLENQGLEALANESIAVLRDVLGQNPISDEQLHRGRLASRTLGNYATLVQTRGAQEAARYAMARDVLSPEERTEYVRLAMPDHGVVKLLDMKEGAK